MTSLPLCISFAGRAIRGSRASLMITGYNGDEEIEEDACQSLVYSTQTCDVKISLPIYEFHVTIKYVTGTIY